jgi:hypothetical protein
MGNDELAVGETRTECRYSILFGVEGVAFTHKGWLGDVRKARDVAKALSLNGYSPRILRSVDYHYRTSRAIGWVGSACQKLTVEDLERIVDDPNYKLPDFSEEKSRSEQP